MSEIRVDSIIDEAGTGAVELTQGASIPSGKTLSGDGSINAGLIPTLNQDTTGTAALAEGLTGTPNITVGDITATTGDLSVRNITGVAATFNGNVIVNGVLTYEDVTNVDSLGIITARAGISIGAGQSVGSSSGTVTYYGDGSNLSGVSASGGITTTASSPSANTTVTLNLSTAQHHQLTLTAGITTISCQGGTFGESHSLTLIQPSSGITTVGFSTYFLFPSGADPSMSEGSGKIDLVSFVVHRVGTAGTQLLASAGLNYQ